MRKTIEVKYLLEPEEDLAEGQVLCSRTEVRITNRVNTGKALDREPSFYSTEAFYNVDSQQNSPNSDH